MKRNWKEYRKQKHQFKGGNYCVNCQQKRSCGILDEKKKYCCSCYQEILEELERDKLLINSAQLVLNDYRSGVSNCQCLGSEKPRVSYLSSDGSGWSGCGRCEKIVSSAGHHRVVKNRNDPKFWGLEVEEKILCGNCLGSLVEKMPRRKKYLFREYGKRGYW